MKQGWFERTIGGFLEHHTVGVLVWFFAAIAIALVASARGRSMPGWFAISFFLSPLIGGILLFAVVGPVRDDAES